MTTLTTTPQVTSTTLYLLPGYGGRLTAGLGLGLLNRGFQVAGRETTGDFRNLRFMDQITTVAEDLQTHFWREDARVVANSTSPCRWCPRRGTCWGMAT